MPVLSPLSSCWNRIEAIPASVFPFGIRPPVFVNSVPISSGGLVQRPPYIVIVDRGMRLESTLSHFGGLEIATIDVEVYSLGLALLDETIMAIKYGGDNPNLTQGLDWGNWAADPPYEMVHVKKVQEIRQYDGWDADALPVYKGVLTYEVTWGLRG